MSGSLTLALRTAQSGLLSNQEALNAVSNNIANVNTPGYSRKVVNMEQRVVSGVGSGVQVSEITRKVDEGLIKSMRLEISTLNALDARDPYYSRLQELFGRPDENTSLSHVMNEYTNAVETLALNPASTIEQSEVMRRGRDVAEMLNRMSETIQELRLQADAEIATSTDRVGVLLASVSTLNNKLISNSAINVDVTDLRDQRDIALDELSSLIDIRYYYRSDGDAVVFSEGGRSLVDNAGATMTHTQASAINATTNHSEGDLNGIYVGAVTAANDITDEIRNGRLKGLIDMRDTVLQNLQSQIDEFSAELRDAVNLAHNAGAPFPGLQSASGTRDFIDSSVQTITFGGTTDTTLAMVDGSGNQTATTTMRTLLGGATGTIDAVATAMQTWFRANGASGATVALSNTTDGTLAIDLNTTTTNFVMRDEAATASGSTAQDATITFDADGAFGGATETVSGFSNFFGLNDFYTDTTTANIHDSNVLTSSYTLATSTTLSFYNAGSTAAATIGAATVSLTAGMNLDQIVTTINATTNVGVTATKVPDGSGFRLRIAEAEGNSMVVKDSSTFTTDVGLDVASTRSSSLLQVRSDILTTPGKISRGNLQWDAAKGAAGEYLMSVNDGSAINGVATTLSAANQFSESGGLAALNVNFTAFSVSIISYNASISSSNLSELGYQQTLTESLEAKSNNFRGVSLDEEMTQLMLFEQAYGAAARIASTVQKMFDALENIL